MIFRVLGCSGSELGRFHPCSFQIGANILIDMGSAASRLTIEEQSKVTDILLSHAHLDHTKDVAFFAENVFTLVKEPVVVRSTQDTIDKIRDSLLNNKLWPDFTQLPSKSKAILRYEAFKSNQKFKIGNVEIFSVPVDHPGGCLALFFSSGAGTVLYTGDTGPTDAVWEEVNRRGGEMKAILLETSFPNRLLQVAKDSGHHTPDTLAGEIKKIRSKKTPIFVYHMKAPYQDEIIPELNRLEDPRIRILEAGMRIEF